MGPATSVGANVRATLSNPTYQDLLDRYGFAVVPAADESLLRELSDLHTEVGVAPDDPQVALHFGFHSQDEAYKRRVADSLLPLVEDLVDELFDRHEVYLPMFITKWAGPNSGFGPHQDPTLVDEREFRGVKIWIPLTDTGVVDGHDNGMLHVVPGSHRFLGSLRTRDVDNFAFAEQEHLIVEEFGVGIPTRAGEAIVFDDRLIHYSLPNATPNPRVVVALGMRPTEADCVMLRTSGDVVEMYRIDQERYLDLVPAALYLYEPDDDPIEVLAPSDERVTDEQFTQLCTEVGAAPGTVPGRRPADSGSDDQVDPGLFCAFCGSTALLEVDDRNGLAKAQLLCAPCRARLEQAPPGASTSNSDLPRLSRRVLVVGGSPDGSAADRRLREVAATLRERGATVDAVMLLDGDDRSHWADAVDRLVVVDDVRSWRPAALVGTLWRGGGDHLRGLRLRMALRRLGQPDVALLHDGYGDRVLDLMPNIPLVCGVRTVEGQPTVTASDSPSTRLDAEVAAGTGEVSDEVLNVARLVLEAQA